MKRYKVPKSHYKLCSTSPGRLIPVSCYEALPGDTIRQSSQALVRVSPLVTPVMHPMVVRLHTWQVPLRIIWPEFEQFITGGPDGNDATLPPEATGVTVAEGSVADYLGITPGTRSYVTLPMKAVARIFNEKYRDQDLVPEIDEDSYDGTDAPPYVAWEKDRFGSARPWPQKGPDVTLPMGETAPLRRVDSAGASSVYLANGNTFAGANPLESTAGGGLWGVTQGQPLMLDNSNGMEVDLTQAVSPNINDWRTAFAVQRWQEARAQYGSRFTEFLRYLGIRSSDARLQLPEYLGGGKQVISFSEVLGSYDGGESGGVLGQLGGHGIAAIRTRPFTRFIEEHSYIITLMSVRPKAMYMNTQHRMFDRRDKLDWWQKELQYVGQEPIYNKEIYADHSAPNGVFGYNDRYSSFRSVPSTVAGEMRSVLNSWHVARDFGSDVTLNQSFIDCVPTNRIYADTGDNDKLICMVNNSVRTRSLLDPRPYNRIL